jgi:hypothetical protein
VIDHTVSLVAVRINSSLTSLSKPMLQEIRYLNTDLDLVSPQDLTPLVAAFKSAGVYTLHCDQDSTTGNWHGTFESETSHNSPEPEIDLAVLLAAIESLSPPLRDQWLACTLKEFNIGYDCGDDPWAFNNGLSAQTLHRLAAAQVSLRITLYPPRE